MAFIHLIRHGQASFGGADYDELSNTGKLQGNKVANRLAITHSKCSRLICGSMKRHIQTANAVMEKLTLPKTETDPQWNEFDFMDVIKCFRPELGSYDNLKLWIASQSNPLQAFQQLYEEATQRWIAGKNDEDYIESRQAFCDRVHNALDNAAKDLPKGENILIFTSGGPIAAIAQKLLDISNKQTQRLERVLVNAGITTLSAKDGKYRLISLNCYGHLEMDHDKLITYR